MEVYVCFLSKIQKGTNVRMLTNHRFWKRMAALLAALILTALPLLSLAEEAEASITHIARATVALKVRREPDSNAPASDSIPKGSFVSIIEFGDEWCKVRTERLEGWVMTKYLTEILAQDDSIRPVEEETPVAEDAQPGFTMDKATFEEKYYAHALRDLAPVCAEPDLNSYHQTTVGAYKKVIVGEISGGWAFVRYGNVYGYMRVEHLFKWDRIDPYAGDIPGLEIWDYVAFVNHTTTVRDINTGKELQTVNPGSAIAVGEKDTFGRYPLPIDRTTGYITEEDVAYLLPVVDWAEAQPGDLLSVMTTFFGVGKTTLQFQGRNWNIHLASGMISNVVLQPNEEFVMNEVIGPYRQSTGYHSAPIMSDDALSGYGGGTCQVNTTFYNTVMQVPLLVTHRRVHAEVGMYYVKQGFDAAVGGGDINLKMINTLPYPVRFLFLNSDGVLTCCVFRNN